MICWYCYWGWPKQIAEIYNKYLDIAGESAMHYGSAHIVWEDENFERHQIQWCLDNFCKNDEKYHSLEELETVKQSLLELLKLSDEVLESEPEDYDGEHPENFPPTMEMVRV